MGRGGGGGGRSGGSRSGGSRGGSYRSSGGGGRGSHSSGRGSLSSGFSGGHSSFYYGSNRRGYYSPVRVVPIRGASSFILTAVAIIFILSMFISIVALSSPGASITKSTVERTPLNPASYSTIRDWVIDELGWVHSTSKVEKGLKAFYNETGVQPLLYIVEDINGDYYPEGPAVQELANQVYDQYIGDDEGHIVFVFQCRDNDTQYTMATCIGAAAKQVMDSEAEDILYDYFDYYWYEADTEDEMFADSFAQAGKRIMNKSFNWTPIIILAVICLIALVVILILVNKAIKRKKEIEERNDRLLHADIPDIDE